MALKTAEVAPPLERTNTDASSLSSRRSYDKGSVIHFKTTELPPRPLAYKRKDAAREKLNHAGRTLKKFAKFIGPG